MAERGGELRERREPAHLRGYRVRGLVGTACAVLAYALKAHPQRNLWMRAAESEKAHGGEGARVQVISLLGLPFYLADTYFDLKSLDAIVRCQSRERKNLAHSCQIQIRGLKWRIRRCERTVDSRKEKGRH